MKEKINIAIDGYSSCGKSTLAKQLAQALGYIYVDTGAMYRAVALYCLRNEIIDDDQVDVERLIAELDDIHIRFTYNSDKKISETCLNGENVEDEIREMEVSRNVSRISIIREVRDKLVAIQREIGKEKGIVMDGRDIGTVVFPDAEVKFFMTADKEIRAKRRYDELQLKGVEVTLEEIKENISKRDFDDMTRKENPLKQADDAIVIDNSNINQQEQFELAMEQVQAILKKG